MNYDEDTQKFVQSHIEQSTGRHLNEREALAKLYAEEEARLNKAA